MTHRTSGTRQARIVLCNAGITATFNRRKLLIDTRLTHLLVQDYGSRAGLYLPKVYPVKEE